MADKPVCKINGCGKPAAGLGLCHMHWRRNKLYGDPLGSAPPRQSSRKRCIVDGCNNLRHGHGLCSKHHRRKRVFGDTVTRLRPANGEALAFLDMAKLHTGDDCLYWPFNRQRNGYAVAVVEGVTQRVHRVVCEAVHGPSPQDEMQVAHSCGRGRQGCVNPRHLRWATASENCADKVRHGTHNRGERHNLVKLSEDDVRAIRAARGKVYQRVLAQQYGVSRPTITMIQTGKTWSHLE